MTQSDPAIAQPKADTLVPDSFFARCKAYVSGFNQLVTYVVGLPAITLLGSVVTGHFQYVSAYQDKVNAEAARQFNAADAVFNDISAKLSKMITLQQFIYFNFKQAIENEAYKDEKALVTRNARAAYPQYLELRTDFRENINLLARQVEIALDWPSNLTRDAAHVQSLGADPVNFSKLGAYELSCDTDRDMPFFTPPDPHTPLPPPKELLKEIPNAPTIELKWFSAKHQLLTLYFCVEKTHENIEAARKWASGSTFSDADKQLPKNKINRIKDMLDRDVVRLNAFMTLAMREIEVIRVKFRVHPWYCKAPIILEIINSLSNRCTPLATAEASAPKLVDPGASKK